MGFGVLSEPCFISDISILGMAQLPLIVTNLWCQSLQGAIVSDEQNAIQAALTEKLHDSFDYVLKKRREYFKENPDKLPVASQVKSIINSCVRNNSAISGGAGLIPGPAGALVVVPELVLVIRNQIQMVYDIGVANGKEAQITRELLLGIFVTAMGSGATSLVTVQGGKLLVKRASLRVIQKIIAWLGGKITQQALKRYISKWVPIAGAAAMAVWTGWMTKNIGQKANELFKLEIDDDPNTLDIELFCSEPLEQESQ